MALELQVMIVYKACSFALCFKTSMTALAWSGLVRTAVKQWTRASRVSVSVQPDTLRPVASFDSGGVLRWTKSKTPINFSWENKKNCPFLTMLDKNWQFFWCAAGENYDFLAL